MMRAQVTGNAIQFSVSRTEVLLIVASIVMVLMLVVFAGWKIAAIAVGMSALGAVAVDIVQRSDMTMMGK
ncbi:MAG TPA: hypothetical protein VFK89_06900 [Actinomycetota bacterium]|nr:hypothetical protein [Actinomycetota bacterium]